MSYTIMILSNGVCAFHRSYGDMNFDDIQLVGGFFHALLTFSTQLGEGVLDSIKFSYLNIFFKSFEGFTFVLAVSQEMKISSEQVETILNKLAKQFYEKFPSAKNWRGDITEFDEFATICDTVLQVQPKRKGFPLLLKLALKPFLIAPALQILFINSETSDQFYELQHRLEQFSETLGAKKLKTFLEQPTVILLPNTKSLVYLIAFSYKGKKADLSHLLCLFVKEKDWFMFYQLYSIIYKRTQQILPKITSYLQKYDKDPRSIEISEFAPIIQDTVENWADLNQYVGSVQATLFEEYYKLGLTGDAPTEEEEISQFYTLISLMGNDIDKVLFALLSQEPVVFVGESKNQVEKTIMALLNFYPHPSVSFWTESPGDYLITGTHPINLVNFGVEPVFVDIDDKRVSGGTKNEFCADLIRKTMELAEIESVSEARGFFQGKISNVFTVLKSFLEIVSDGEVRSKDLEKLLDLYSPAALRLIAKMSENLNPLLTKNIKSVLKLKDLVGRLGLPF